MMTPFIRMLSVIRVRCCTEQLLPSTVFFSDVLSQMNVLSPTAHCVICVDLMVVFGQISGGAGAAFINGSNSLPNSDSHTVKIYALTDDRLNQYGGRFLLFYVY